MKKIISILFVALSVAVAPIATFANEPTNIAFVKKELKQYHNSGEYKKDIDLVNEEALSYLKDRVEKNDFQGKKPAIVLDIDETALSNYPHMVTEDFGGTLIEFHEYMQKGQDPVISSTLKLFQYARANNVAVIFITGRHESERQITIENLIKTGYKDWDQLYMRAPNQEKIPATAFKSKIRKALTEKGYDILLSMGDQKSDLAGGYADKTFKLPNPYYFIP